MKFNYGTKYRIVKVEDYKKPTRFRLEIGYIQQFGQFEGHTLWEPLYRDLSWRNEHITLESAETELKEFIAREEGHKETVVKVYE